MIDNNDWIKAIQQKAEQAIREVPKGTWEAISNSLPQQAPAAPKRGRIAPRMWKAVAAAAAVAIVATTGFFMLNNDRQPANPAPLASAPKPQTETPATSPAEISQPASETAIPAPNEPVSTVTTPMLAQESNRSHHRHSSKSAKSHKSARHSFDNEMNEMNEAEYYADNNGFEEEYNFNPDEYFYDIETMQALEELYAQYDDAMNQEAMEPWRNYSDSTYQQHLVYDANARRAAREKMAMRKGNKQSTMRLMAYGNGLISTDRNNTVSGTTAQMLAPAANGSTAMMMAPAAPGVTSPKVALPVNYSYHHHMPLTFGVNFTKRIVRNLYGNVGLNFTSMSSDVTPDNGEDSFKQNVKLIGLPFGIRWNFWRYKGFSTYVGGEGLVERVVDASFGKEDITIKRLQWSVHATAGAQYNFTKHIGLYVEPKLSHYITTMPLNTQRNEHPFNFNLQFGLSIDF